MVAIKEKPEKVFAKQGLTDTTLRMSVARPGGPRSVAAVESPPGRAALRRGRRIAATIPLIYAILSPCKNQ